MKALQLKYLGDFSIKSIRNFILDNKVVAGSCITLNSNNFDDLASDYRDAYRKSLEEPFVLIGVLVEEDVSGKIPENRILVDQESKRLLEIQEAENAIPYEDEIIYRCGWCGNVVDFDGSELDAILRSRKISSLQKFGSDIEIHRVHGTCCPHQS